MTGTFQSNLTSRHISRAFIEEWRARNDYNVRSQASTMNNSGIGIVVLMKKIVSPYLPQYNVPF